ncbi:MAG: hypothetical protein QOH04_2525, partial [Sphingomonadales bacterium]|nr:hypothetical protein [Sphingomonadales bacterium]
MSQSTIRLIVGAIIAALFLGLFGYVLIQAIPYAQGISPKGPSDNAFYIMNIAGGLVSAVVVAELAMTATGRAPAGLTFSAPPAVGTAGNAAAGSQLLAIIYVFVWLALGVAALLLGLMD